MPIVVLTGSQDEALGVEALEAGAQDYLVKGQVNDQELARTLRYAIVRKATEEALLRHGVALARARELEYSRQRLVAAQERVRCDIAAQLRDGLRGKLLTLKSSLQRIEKRGGSAPATDRLVKDVIVGLDQAIEQQLDVLARRLYPPGSQPGPFPRLSVLCGSVRRLSNC